eukprot:TRINITY_DN94917_c0_g1_i1.p1 TRINITY_DN94917_c0_g1~~TRINITY_DN94917_c0_g1_i1.p1  ORF type:complete len:217 (+),score=50.77 TRINITY_DN94917_c0_g1_i1:116-766(+)
MSSTEEREKKLLKQRSLLAPILALDSFSSLEEAGIEAAKREYHERYFGQDRQFAGAELVDSQKSGQNQKLILVKMQVCEDGADACPQGFFKTPWDFAIYERTPSAFAILWEMNHSRSFADWEEKLSLRDGINLVKAQFKMCDTDKNGVISASELSETLQKIDSTFWTAEKTNRLMAFIDVNDDHRIDLNEFLDWTFEVGGCDKPSFLKAAEKFIGQ